MTIIDRIKAELKASEGKWRWLTIERKHLAALVEFYEAANEWESIVSVMPSARLQKARAELEKEAGNG